MMIPPRSRPRRSTSPANAFTVSASSLPAPLSRDAEVAQVASTPVARRLSNVPTSAVDERTVTPWAR